MPTLIGVDMAKTVYAREQGQRFNGDASLTVVVCPSCHVTYAIPTSFDRAAREHNSGHNPRNCWNVCCPFGHSWHYTGLNPEQELRRQLERERDRRAQAVARADQAEASRRSQKSAATRARNERDRIKNRVVHGVCPACNRSFKQLRRHMNRMHPEYTHQCDTAKGDVDEG